MENIQLLLEKSLNRRENNKYVYVPEKQNKPYAKKVEKDLNSGDKDLANKLCIWTSAGNIWLVNYTTREELNMLLKKYTIGLGHFDDDDIMQLKAGESLYDEDTFVGKIWGCSEKQWLQNQKRNK